MSNLQSNWTEGEKDVAHTKAWRKYSFVFHVNSVAWHAGYDFAKKKLFINHPYEGAELLNLAEKVEAIIDERESDFFTHDAREFLSKHLRAMTKVEQALHRQLFDSGPFDLAEAKMQEKTQQPK